VQTAQHVAAPRATRDAFDVREAPTRKDGGA